MRNNCQKSCFNNYPVHLHNMTISAHLSLGLSVFLITLVQINWASPAGVSNSDMGIPVFLYPESLSLFITTVISILAAVFSFKRISIKNEITIYTIVLLLYWLLINFIEFEIHVASWSTFSVTESWIHTVMISFLPMICCGTLFLLTAYYILSKRLALSKKPDLINPA